MTAATVGGCCSWPSSREPKGGAGRMASSRAPIGCHGVGDERAGAGRKRFLPLSIRPRRQHGHHGCVAPEDGAMIIDLLEDLVRADDADAATATSPIDRGRFMGGCFAETAPDNGSGVSAETSDRPETPEPDNRLEPTAGEQARATPWWPWPTGRRRPRRRTVAPPIAPTSCSRSISAAGTAAPAVARSSSTALLCVRHRVPAWL